MTCLFLMKVKEIISSFGLEFTFMIGFGTMEICNCGSWSDSLIPVSEYLSLTFLTMHGYNIDHILTLLRYISLKWGVVFTLLDKITTLFFYRISLPLIIYFSMLLVTIMILV